MVGVNQTTPPSAPSPAVIERSDSTEKSAEQPGWQVVVFDTDSNTYEEVMTVLMIATACTSEEAYIEAWEIDHLGLCVVHRADEDECRNAADIIRTIQIPVEVQPCT